MSACRVKAKPTVIPSRPTMSAVSVLEQPGQPNLLVFEPEEGLRRAMPLPAEDELVIEDVTDEEWEAFHEALAER